jgi:D-alanine-D-alanine ligase
MKVAIIYNQDRTAVINTFGMQNKEVYNPKTVKLVAESLEKGGHNVSVIDGNMNVIENLQNFMPKVVEGETFGMVFNMAYGIQGESRYTHIPSLLEMLGIPYVGSSPAGHALALDKVITKIIMQQHQIPTPDFWVFSSAKEDMQNVKYPVIVKPKMESVSFGLKVARNETELKLAVEFVIREFKQQALAEQFIRGREFAVGIIGNSPIETFPVLEIDLNGDPDAIQTAEDKQKKPRAKICPALISEELAQQMKEYSVQAFRALQLRDFARVDIRVDENNRIYLLEINSMASLGRTGSYVYAAKMHGLEYSALVNKMLDVAVVRYFTKDEFLDEQENTDAELPLSIKIRGFLRSHEGQTEKLLSQMVDLNTHVRNIEGVNQFGNILKKQLNVLNFQYQTFPQVEVGNILLFCNNATFDYDILLLGNLDNTTKIGQQEYFRHADQKYYGTGIWEHKGGLMTMLLAMQSLRFSRILRKTKIGILLTSDDALQGRFAKEIIENTSRKAKYVIGLHGAFLNGGIVTSRSGSAVYKCSMNLKNNEQAENVPQSVQAFSRLMIAYTELSDKDAGLLISPSEIKLNSNITDSYAHGEAILSVRFNRNEQIDFIDKKIRKLTPAKIKENVHFQIEGEEKRPAMEFNSQTETFWSNLNELARKLGIRLRKEHRWSSADIAFCPHDIQRIDGLGPVGIKDFKKMEYILKHSLIERATLLALTLKRLSKV